MGVRREHCLRETFQNRIYDLTNQQFHELQYISDTQMQIAHLANISERTFRDNDKFLRHFNVYFCSPFVL